MRTLGVSSSVIWIPEFFGLLANLSQITPKAKYYYQIVMDLFIIEFRTSSGEYQRNTFII